MISKFEILELVEIKCWADIKNRPHYVGDIDPEETQLDEIVAPYDLQDEDIICGITTCHQPHHMGYVVRTRTGDETNIGGYCGRKHFGTDFGLLKNKSEAERRLQRYRRQLNEIIYNSDDIFSRIQRVRKSGADWLYAAQRELRTNYPQPLLTELKSRAQHHNPNLTVGRRRTEDELELAKAENRGKDIEDLLYTEDVVGQLRGLEIFNRSVRDALILELESRLKDLLELDPDTSVHKLKGWYDWSRTLDDLFAEADLLVGEGREFFTSANFELIHRHLMLNHDTEKFVWDFAAPSCHVKRKRSRSAD